MRLLLSQMDKIDRHASATEEIADDASGEAE
jgi:hypothetical protein